MISSTRRIAPQHFLKKHFCHMKPCRDGDFDTMSIKVSVPTFMSKRVVSADFRTFLEKTPLWAKVISGLQRCFFAFL